MNRDQDRADYLKLLEEKDRRMRDQGIEYYEPMENQLKAHQDKSRIICAFGGNRAGKTMWAVSEAVWAALGTHPYHKYEPPLTIWIASDSHAKNRDVFLPMFRRLLPKSAIKKSVSAPREGLLRILLNNGSEFSFKSYEAGRESFQGAEIPLIILDEEPPEDIFTECLMRGLTCKGRVLMAMTPVNGITWVYHKLYRPALLDKTNLMGVGIHHLSTLDNKHVPQEEKVRLTKGLSAEDYKIRVEGRFVHRQGMVFKEFNEGVHVIPSSPVPKGVKFFEGIDPGHHTFAVVFAHTDYFGNVYVHDELYEHEPSIGLMKELIHAKRQQHQARGYLDTVIDPSACAKHIGMSMNVKDQLMESPFPVYSFPGNNDRESGIWRVKQYLNYEMDSDGKPSGKPKLFIMDRCTNLIYEMQNHVYKNPTLKGGVGKNNFTDKVEKRDDHLLDALRYMLMRRPSPQELLAQKKDLYSWDNDDETRQAINLYAHRDRDDQKGWRKAAY